MTPTKITKASLAAAIAGLALALPPAANAGSYQVRSCDDAGGAQNAWTAWSSHQQMTAHSVCPSYGDWTRGIVARNAVPSGSLVVPRGAGAWQFFIAPEGTGITNVRLSGEIHRAAGQRWSVGLSNGAQLLAGVGADTTHAFSWKPNGADVAVPGNNYVYFEAACHAESGCDTRSTGDPASHYVRAAVWIRGTVVTVHDPTTPGVNWGGSLLSGGWLRGDHSFDWSASDNTGIQNVTATFAGRGLIGSDRPCDFTRPQPCAPSDSGSVGVSTAGYPDGVHGIELVVRDASGNPGQLTGQVAIDNTAPARIANVTVDGGDGWRQTNGFQLRWLNPTGQHAPIVRRHYRVCPVDGQSSCVEGSQAGAQSELSLDVPRPGAWRAQVWLEDAAGNQTASNASDPVLLRFDAAAPPAPAIDASSGWLDDTAARKQTIRLRLPDGQAAGPSGIAGYSVTTDGSEPDATIDTDGTWTLTDLAEGDHTLKARAISGAGLASAQSTSVTLKVDRTKPSVDASGLPDPGAWHREPVTLQLTSADSRSGVAAIRWQLDGGETREHGADRAGVTIAQDGRHTLTWEAVDRAGNRSRARQAVIRVDRTAPETVAMRPLDPNRPRMLSATVADQGSGIARGAIQLRPAGGAWRELDTRLGTGTDRLDAELDDEHLPDGRYELRAVARDQVGNERTGDALSISLPLRIASRVTLATATSARRRARTANSRAAIRGRVTGGSGIPISQAAVHVLQRVRTERDWQPVRTITADREGRFRYAAPAGPSRTIRFAYAGTDTVRSSSNERSVRVAARTTIASSRRNARVGQTVVFRGRLLGGYVPPIGKVLVLQAYDQGRWRSFPATVRTDGQGRWRAAQRFERTAGIYTYRIRARVIADAGYPFQTGASRTVKVTVRGR